MNRIARFALPLALAAAGPLAAQGAMPPAATLSYADLADFADHAPLVLRAQVRKQVAVEAARAPGLAPGHVRLFVEARTTALIAGRTPVGESLRYLVDMPLDAKGKIPKIKKKEFILFARAVSGKPGEIQLVKPDAQLPYSPMLEERLHPILTEMLSPDAPPRITGVRDALSVRGTLVGESETQIFLDTENDGPVSITVARRPNMQPVWGVSWSEIVDQAARPPQPETLAWYRLACALPPELPQRANLGHDPQGRALAMRDYRLVIERLGPCERLHAR